MPHKLEPMRIQRKLLICTRSQIRDWCRDGLERAQLVCSRARVDDVRSSFAQLEKVVEICVYDGGGRGNLRGGHVVCMLLQLFPELSVFGLSRWNGDRSTMSGHSETAGSGCSVYIKIWISRVYPGKMLGSESHHSRPPNSFSRSYRRY